MHIQRQRTALAFHSWGVRFLLLLLMGLISGAVTVAIFFAQFGPLDQWSRSGVPWEGVLVVASSGMLLWALATQGLPWPSPGRGARLGAATGLLTSPLVMATAAVQEWWTRGCVSFVRAENCVSGGEALVRIVVLSFFAPFLVGVLWPLMAIGGNALAWGLVAWVWRRMATPDT